MYTNKNVDIKFTAYNGINLRIQIFKIDRNMERKKSYVKNKTQKKGKILNFLVKFQSSKYITFLQS